MAPPPPPPEGRGKDTAYLPGPGQGQARARPGRSAAAAPRQPGPPQTLPAYPAQPAQPTCLPGYPPAQWQSGTVCRRHSWTRRVPAKLGVQPRLNRLGPIKPQYNPQLNNDKLKGPSYSEKRFCLKKKIPFS